MKEKPGQKKYKPTSPPRWVMDAGPITQPRIKQLYYGTAAYNSTQICQGAGQIFH